MTTPKTSEQWLDNTRDEREEKLLEEIEGQLRRKSEDQLRRQFEDQLTEKIEEWIDHTRADREQRIRDLPELIERELRITGPDLDHGKRPRQGGACKHALRPAHPSRDTVPDAAGS
jgi:hypothetical protein